MVITGSVLSFICLTYVHIGDVERKRKHIFKDNLFIFILFINEKYIESTNNNSNSQVKCIHEYKRQLLNITGIVYCYKKMKEMVSEGRKAKYVLFLGYKYLEAKYVPRVYIIGGKAFATYVQAKRMVKFMTGDLLLIMMQTWMTF
jgi:glucan phosphorylase